jgi:hypothetical protein
MYAFIAVFTAQILILSVLGPVKLVGFLRAQIARFVAERAAAVDASAAARVDRRLRPLGLMGMGTGVVGLLLLVGMIRYMLRPDWTDGRLEALVPAYFALQVLPLFLALVTVGRFHEVLKRSLPTEKRKAILEPRGLFDFVSRSAVSLAALAYFLFVAFLLYLEQHPFPGFAGFFTNVAAITLVYAVMAIGICVTLRTRGSTPLQAHEGRMRSVGLAVRICVYSCILYVASLTLNFTLVLLDLQRWEPSLVSVVLVVLALLSLAAAREQLRIPQVNNLSIGQLTR